MKALFGMQDSLHIHEGSPLQLWLKRHGACTVAKYNELLNVGGVGPLTFEAESPAKTFSAYIDPENKFDAVDKFSQVMATCCPIVLKFLKILTRNLCLLDKHLLSEPAVFYHRLQLCSNFSMESFEICNSSCFTSFKRRL